MTGSAADESPAALVATKLHVPVRRRELVARDRLVQRLAVSALPTLTIVSAPAGFGKTTLLSAWVDDVRSAGHRATWLSLDGRDNDPAVFLAYLVAALAPLDPAAAAAARRSAEASEQAHVVLGPLLNGLLAVEGHVVVVLDDYHVIEAQPVHEAVAFLVENLPAHVHLVIAGRADPPLPLGRLRARGELLEVRAADLRFTTEEASQYLNGSMHLSLDAPDIEALEARTEGWIAALQLAAISMQGRDDATEFIASFAGDDRFVVDFLAEEVLERQPPEVRDFLLDTSVLERFTAEACDAVTCRDGGLAMLDRLDRANLFLVPLDARRQWYRYHHLFADVLRARLLADDPSRVIELHRRASAWYERQGDTGSAITHALDARDHDRAAALLEVATPGLRRARQDQSLRTWLEALPPEVFADRPRLAMALVGARVVTHDPTGVPELLGMVERHLDDVGSRGDDADREELDGLRAEVLVHRTGLLMLAGDFESCVPLGREVLGLARPGDDRLRGTANALMGLGHWAAGELETAEARYREAIAAFAASEHLPDMLGCSLALADIQIALGRLAEAQRTFEHGLRWTSEHRGLRGAADMHVGLAEVLIERNELAIADDHLAASLALGESAGLPQHPYRWRVTTARLCRARGELDRALALLAEAAPLYQTDFSPPVRPVAALQARVLLAGGDVAGAARWAMERGLRADEATSYILEFEHITLVRVLIARHERDRDPGPLADALRLLDRLGEDAEAGRRTGSLIEIRILQAAALHAAGRDAEATRSLEAALTLAGAEGHVRLFLHAGPGVIALLRTLDEHVAAVPALREALDAAATGQRPPPRPGGDDGLVEPLSGRELDVLRMLRTDLSGPDIAAELFVSLNTLRTHTRNIYVKLGVGNRREAVRRAAELGL